MDCPVLSMDLQSPVDSSWTPENLLQDVPISTSSLSDQ